MPEENENECYKLHNNAHTSRWWVFTINNPTNDDKKQLDLLCNDSVHYMCYGHEIGKITNTPHLQGYVELTKPQKFTWLKKRVTRAYIAVRRGSRTQARDYCFKECTEPYEYGKWIPDRQGMRNELLQIKRKIDNGVTIDELWEDHFSSMLRYGRGFKEYLLVYAKKCACGEINCYWYYGPSGSGKSRAAWDKYPNAYNKANNKWWDAYSGEEVVIWDDFCMPKDISYQELLRWTDRYKKTGETKGGTVPLLYKTIIFTSIHPPNWHAWCDNQLVRRFNDGVNITPVTSLQNVSSE